MKKFLAIALAAVLVLVLFTACGGDSKIVGTWLGEETEEELGMTAVEKYTFSKDGKLTVSADIKGGEDLGLDLSELIPSYEGTYKVSGNKLTVSFEGEEETSTFSIDGDKLTINDGETTKVLTRK